MTSNISPSNAAPVSTWHYNKELLVKALRAVGLEKGDTVFSHVGLGTLGYPQEGASIDAACRVLDEAFLEILGPEGTWVLPGFSYSYSNHEIYDLQTTKSQAGPFCEYFRGLKSVLRSRDPMVSVLVRGPLALPLLNGLPLDSFGPDCVYDRLRKAGAKICNVGVGIYYTTFVHYAEQMMSAPYRFLKKFQGKTKDSRGETQEAWNYFARFQVPEAAADLGRLEKEVQKSIFLKTANVGRGAVFSIELEALWDILKKNMERDAWFLAAGPPKDMNEAARS